MTDGVACGHRLAMTHILTFNVQHFARPAGLVPGLLVYHPKSAIESI